MQLLSPQLSEYPTKSTKSHRGFRERETEIETHRERWVGRQKVCVGGVWEQLGVRDEYDPNTFYKILKEYKTNIILKNIRFIPRM